MVTLVANTRGYPFFSICGIITDPMAEVSATDDPEMPLRKVVATTLTTDRPPRMRKNPTSTLAKATSLRAMPPSAMIAPASTKKGIVSIATLLTPSEILSITASSGMPIHMAPAIAAKPSEYAIGTPMAKHPKRVKMTTKNSTGKAYRTSVTWSIGRFRWRRRPPDQQSLDNEHERNCSADRDGQIGDAHRERRKVRDRLIPSGFDQSAAPHAHKHAERRQQRLGGR